MIRTCPDCHGFHVRRSSIPESCATWRHILLSPYRCCDCRARFWKISQKAYLIVGAVSGTIALWGIVWLVIGVLLNVELTPMLHTSR